MDTSLPKKYKTTYVYSDTIVRIAKILNEIKFIEEINSKTQLPFLFTDKPIPLIFNYTVLEMTSLEYSKIFTWLITSKEIPSSIHYSFTLSSNTLDNTTLVIFELVIVNPEKVPQSSYGKIRSGCDKICKEVINALDTLLQSYHDHIIQCESVIVKASRERIWDYFVHLEFLKKINVKDIIINGEPGQIGTTISWKMNDNIRCSSKIIKISRKINNIKWMYQLASIENLFESQEIVFTLIKLSKNETFLSIAHKFNEQISPETLNILEERKKNNLMNLKKQLEEEQDDNPSKRSTNNSNMSIDKEVEQISLE